MSVQAFDIPLSPSAAQKFSVSLSGAVYTMQVRWNDASQCWVLDILDSTNKAILQGVPLVTGCNLLGEFAYLGIAGQLIVQTDNDAFAVPTFANLGSTGHLYYVVTQ